MNVLMVSSEATPYLNTSHVADVVTELSFELRRQGHDVRIAIPRYRSGRFTGKENTTIISGLKIPMGDLHREASIIKMTYTPDPSDNIPIYLVDNSLYFGREQPYGYLDDYERFIFFTRSILEMLIHPSFKNEEWIPNIIHGHDWIAGFIPQWIRSTYAHNETLKTVRFVYTLHNAGFTGKFGYRALEIADLCNEGIFRDMGENDNVINLMVRGVIFSDKVNTVSKRHAKEIVEGAYARELYAAFEKRGKDLVGIPNGIDTVLFDPAHDKAIAPMNFGQGTLDRRTFIKLELQKKYGFQENGDIPLFAMIGRVLFEKGFNLLIDVLPDLLNEGVQLIVLASSGENHYYEELIDFTHKYQTKLHVHFGIDENEVRRVNAGADILLMPSLYEPCGRNQMIAMRYGAIPLVRDTGGLSDTVALFDSKFASQGKGFVFHDFEATDFMCTIKVALDIYRNHSSVWKNLQCQNMRVGFSWVNSSKEYEEFYNEALSAPRKNILTKGDTVCTVPTRSLLIHEILRFNEETNVFKQEIDSFDFSEYLCRVACSVRRLLKTDQVLIWIKDPTNPFILVLKGHAFDKESLSEQGIILEKQHVFAGRGMRSWNSHFIYETVVENNQIKEEGFLKSDLARNQGWSQQISVPIGTSGSVVGRLDAFSGKLRNNKFNNDDIEILIALANTIAVNLDKRNYCDTINKLIKAEREMAAEYEIDKLADIILQYIVILTHADYTQLELVNGMSFSKNATKSLNGKPIEEKENIQQIEQKNKNFYLTMPIMSQMGKNVGTINAVKSNSSFFSREEEYCLKEIASLSAGFITAIDRAESTDKMRVEHMRKLASCLVGVEKFDQLLQDVMMMIIDQFKAEAASLYLFDESKNKIVIRAAGGYDRVFMAKKIEFDTDEGLVGSIYTKGKSYKFDNSEQIRQIMPWDDWSRKYKVLDENIKIPNSFLGVPLKITDRQKNEKIIGVLKFENRNANVSNSETKFTEQDLRLVEMMGEMIATVAHIISESENQLGQFEGNLQKLSNSLAGSRDMNDLVNQVVTTIADVLGAKALSLYLIDDLTKKLKIRAATGYQKVLLDKNAEYDIGQGITGWIAESGKPFRADTRENVAEHPKHKGKHDTFQSTTANTLLGLPLIVVDRYTKEKKTIGVLKIEEIQQTQLHPENRFTDQDVLLASMMANVIATILYNTQVSEDNLRRFSENLQKLSNTMAGTTEIENLVNQVVTTIADVLGAMALSLYLIDESTKKLKIRAATGYQKVLLDKKAEYDIGQGITGWIAEYGKPFRADTREQVEKHPKHKGKHDNFQSTTANTLLGLPLIVVDRYTKEKKTIGVLKIEEIQQTQLHPEDRFTDQDELLASMMANVIATVLYNTQVSEDNLRRFSENLQKLSNTMAGTTEIENLVNQVVNTIADVLGARALSLYLIDESTNKLKIRAATGYQKVLLDKNAEYDIGQGITGWIAEYGKPFRADTREQVEKHPKHKGKHDKHQSTTANTLLGLPITIIDRYTKEKKTIGVLKIEEIQQTSLHPENKFTDQDVLLASMMAEVIATVVYNTEVSEHQISWLGGNLEKISQTIRQGHKLSDLMQYIVNEISQLFNAKTTSLYLIDEATDEVQMEASNETTPEKQREGKGITEWIARTGEIVNARKQTELIEHQGNASLKLEKTIDDYPQTFLGVPLEIKENIGRKDGFRVKVKGKDRSKILGVLQIENIKQSVQHPEDYFTDIDERIFKIIANVIANIIYVNRQNENTIGEYVLRRFGTLSQPINAVSDLLHDFARSPDKGILDQMAKVISAKCEKDNNREVIINEIKEMVQAGASPQLYLLIKNRLQNPDLSWLFYLYYTIINNSAIDDTWTKFELLAKPWLYLQGNKSNETEFAKSVIFLCEYIVEKLQTKIIIDYSNPHGTAVAIETEAIFGISTKVVIAVFLRDPENDLPTLDYNFSTILQSNPSAVILFIQWAGETTTAVLSKTRDRLSMLGYHFAIATIADIIAIIKAPEPDEEFRGLLLRQIEAISPFVIVGPVPDRMFFGRERELTAISNYIRDGRSCAIIGGRRIGKTSILHRLNRVSLPPLACHSIYLTCEAIESYQQFMDTPIRGWSPSSPKNALKTFGELLSNAKLDRPLALLLDEADTLIPYDQKAGWPIFRKLREFSNMQFGRIVLCGEQFLRTALRDSSSPLFNLANEIMIGILEFDAVKELIVKPMRQLQITLLNEKELIQYIYESTSGHPNIVQRLCLRLINELNKRKIKKIDRKLVDEIIFNPKFQRDDFLDTLWSRTTNIEKIITLIMSQNNKKYTLNMVKDAITNNYNINPSAKELDDAIQRLIDLRSILKGDAEGYDFAVKSFPKIIGDTNTANDFAKIFIEEYQQEIKL